MTCTCIRYKLHPMCEEHTYVHTYICRKSSRDSCVIQCLALRRSAIMGRVSKPWGGGNLSLEWAPYPLYETALVCKMAKRIECAVQFCDWVVVFPEFWVRSELSVGRLGRSPPMMRRLSHQNWPIRLRMWWRRSQSVKRSTVGCYGNIESDGWKAK